MTRLNGLWAMRVMPWLAFLLMCLVTLAGQSVAAQTVGQGHVDQVRLDTATGVLEVSGWAAPETPSVFTTQLTLLLGDAQIYKGRFDRQDRPDVVQSTHRDDWMSSGFFVRVQLPTSGTAGPQPLSVRMRLGDGQIFELGVPEHLKTVRWEPRHRPGAARLWALALAIFMPVFFCVMPWARPVFAVGPLRKPFERLERYGARWFAVSVFASFVLLVLGGWTGSSMGLAFKNSPMVVSDHIPVLGQDQVIRSDEWETWTPLALSQRAHVPHFPVVNQNLGTDGQNMLVIGMTGVPVAHFSSVAKPATWGFWLGDLRMALAWYWWFPWYAAFLALWQVMVRMLRLQWPMAALLAVITVASPYAAVFSGWPAYVIFFAMTGALGVHGLVQAKSYRASLCWGALMGWAFSGYLLILYPPWLISVGYVTLALLVGWLWSSRGQWRWDAVQWIGLGLALGLVLVLAAGWWRDASDAVDALRQTHYPGKRLAEKGGDIDLWFAIKGWISPFTIYASNSPMVSPDAGSYPWLWPAIFLMMWLYRRSGAPVRIIGWLLIVSVVAIAGYMYVGLPVSLAKITLWSQATSFRMDLALGLAQGLLLACLIHQMVAVRHQLSPAQSMGRAVLMLVLVSICAVWMYQKMSASMQSVLPPAWLGLALGVAMVVHVLWVLEKPFLSMGLLGVWSLIPSLAYNPLSVSPTYVNLRADQPAFDGGHVAVSGHSMWTTWLPAVGVPVTNTLFFYPPTRFWQSFDPQGRQQLVYNRYQRLVIRLNDVPQQPYYTLVTPRLDVAMVLMDPAKADFRLTGGRWLLAPPEDVEKLNLNISLRSLKTDTAWSWFQIVEQPALTRDTR